MNPEHIIKEHDSGRRPFTTPDGYFESFTQRLMQRLPEQTHGQKETPVVTLRPARRMLQYAAAVAVAVICVGGGLYLYNRQDTQTAMNVAAEDMLDDDGNIEEILDYEMLSNNQIAYYLTEAY